MFAKIAIYAVIGLATFAGGMITHARIQKPLEIPEYKCPACNCPPAVELQHFDVEKLKNNKGTFVYSPQIQGVSISGTDSTFFKQIIHQAVKESLDDLVRGKKLKIR